MVIVITPHMVLWALLLCHVWCRRCCDHAAFCHRHCYCVAMVGIILRSYLLHGHSGCCCAMLYCRCCHCMAVVGILLWLCLLHGHMIGVITPCCVAGAVIVWPQWVSCCSHVCCMAMVSVVVPCCVAVGVVMPCCVVVMMGVMAWMPGPGNWTLFYLLDCRTSSHNL
jgi:hypothetical protein